MSRSTQFFEMCFYEGSHVSYKQLLHFVLVGSHLQSRGSGDSMPPEKGMEWLKHWLGLANAKDARNMVPLLREFHDVASLFKVGAGKWPLNGTGSHFHYSENFPEYNAQVKSLKMIRPKTLSLYLIVRVNNEIKIKREL
ncbi:unnamed protein product [Rodentolepis nana]|uniref:ACB domain-containing protein n=1 Tax=Rodentolepis nana TaxID=102285 RepID=A0A0R3TR37_RODNA|nr:unnamed protein product [Rodentolepis nana]